MLHGTYTREFGEFTLARCRYLAQLFHQASCLRHSMYKRALVSDAARVATENEVCLNFEEQHCLEIQKLTLWPIK